MVWPESVLRADFKVPVIVAELQNFSNFPVFGVVFFWCGIALTCFAPHIDFAASIVEVFYFTVTIAGSIIVLVDAAAIAGRAFFPGVSAGRWGQGGQVKPSVSVNQSGNLISSQGIKIMKYRTTRITFTDDRNFACVVAGIMRSMGFV
ncbi:hypothetical protein [Pseudomonas sp. Marseille-P9899]|uniref:hypothetical protein n=1 Tax=Pseudomonas sp. Marseille-P9899 TaxID=2730401 RepID=UPI00158CB819|nr:hypothetical protein [Pseudomonas sp. Marseille-P9899]